MTTAIIADDEPNMRELLRDHIEALWPELQIIGEAGDGPSALIMIETERPDIAFLDVRMPGMDGLEVASKLTVQTRVVFVTAHGVHAAKSYEVDAFDFIVKPVEPTRMAQVIAKLKRDTAEGPPLDVNQYATAFAKFIAAGALPGSVKLSERKVLTWINIDTGRTIRQLHIDEVMYFESDEKTTRVVHSEGHGAMSMSLKALLSELNQDDFLQIDRRAIVNRRFIHAVHRKDDVVQVEIKGSGDRLKVSKPHHYLFKAM